MIDSPTMRLFSRIEAERTDGLGFLDRDRSPQLLMFDELLDHPVTWIVGRPWLGKSTVARSVHHRLAMSSDTETSHWHSVTNLGDPALKSLPPVWWDRWRERSPEESALWLVDGVDEALDSNGNVFGQILDALCSLPNDHRNKLRLVLFSRPNDGLKEFKQHLDEVFSLWGDAPTYWLTRLDRESAEKMVGSTKFPAIARIINENRLNSIAGFPVVLNYLAAHGGEKGTYGLVDVWKGILRALLGERTTNRRASLSTDLEDRFRAAQRIAAMMSLTNDNIIREESLARERLTIGSLWTRPDNLLHSAARDACRSAAFVGLSDPGAFRFTQRNIQDWFTAFELKAIPPVALKSALIGGDGLIIPRLLDSARLLKAISDDRLLIDELDRISGGMLLPTDAFEPTLAAACRQLDQLEEIATSAPWGLRLGHDQQQELTRLSVEGLDLELARRLADLGRSPQAKRFLIEVAEATNAVQAVESALSIVLNADANDELRYECLWFVCKFGGIAHLRTLEVPVAKNASAGDLDCRMRAVVIDALLDKGEWNISEAARFMPARADFVLDQRVTLVNRVVSGLTRDDARSLLPHLRTLHERHRRRSRDYEFPELIQKIIDLVDSPASSPNEIRAIVEFAVGLVDRERGWALARKLIAKFHRHAAARRRFYELDVAAVRDGRADHVVFYSALIPGDDLDWLFENAQEKWGEVRDVWKDICWMAFQANDAGQISEERRRQIFARIDEAFPNVVAEIESAREFGRRRAAELPEDDEESSATIEIEMSIWIQRLRDDPAISTGERMRWFGFVCFASMGEIDGIRGDWSTVSKELKDYVASECRLGLQTEAPTPIPDGSSYSSAILGEGASFEFSATREAPDAWLNESLVRNWLSTTLFCRQSGETTGLIRQCWQVSSVATEAALLKTIERELRSRDRPYIIRSIPSECWTEPMIDLLRSSIRDPAFRAESRIELLECLGQLQRGEAEGISKEWATTPVTANGDEKVLRVGGRDTLLTLNPAAAIELIEYDFNSRGAAVLEELQSLSGGRVYDLAFDSWNDGDIGRLTALLVRAFPPATDPGPHRFHSGVKDELRHLRGRLITRLLHHQTDAALAALSNLAALDPEIAEWISTENAIQKANALLAIPGPDAVPRDLSLTIAEASKLIDRTGYRLIRTSTDLLEAVRETLQKTADSIPDDLALLYGRPERKSPRPLKTARGNLRIHLDEDSLQAYLRHCLREWLPRISDNVRVDVIREERVRYRQRFDIRVVAPCRDTRELATVVVEVKWSDNADLSKALPDQLGRRYLKEEGNTHGILCVGWTGEWKSGEGADANRSLGRLEAFLKEQRDAFCGAGGAGHGLAIEPIVLDIRWERAAPTKKRVTARSVRRKKKPPK